MPGDEVNSRPKSPNTKYAKKNFDASMMGGNVDKLSTNMVSLPIANFMIILQYVYSAGSTKHIFQNLFIVDNHDGGGNLPRCSSPI